jgi:c-di-GMP-binding flagellar brake protein YcgR
MDFTSLYQTRLQSTFDEDHSAIMFSLRSAFYQDKKLELQLINYYKGMPVSFTAKVVGVEKGVLELDVNPQQAVAIADEHYTFIRSKLFRQDIVATAQNVSIKRKAVSLRQLCFVEILAERRNHIRLRLNQAVDALYASAEGTVRGKVIELSTTGTAMLVERSDDARIGEEAKLLFMLPDADTNTTCSVKVQATLIGISGNENRYHYKLKFTPDKVSERHIAKFLFNRQIEIVRTLKDNSEIG